MKRVLSVLGLILVLMSNSLASYANDSLKVGKHAVSKSKFILNKVVLDAGHGGKDVGTTTAGVYEKNIALSITLKLGKLIKKNLPGVEVVYTRDDDTFIPLYKRAEIANKSNADLFISIHCNAASSSAYGTETFTLGLHRTDDNFDVAKRENEVIYLEEDYKENYQGFDPNDPASYIIFELFQSQNLSQSNYFASKVEQEFRSVNRKSRGVKQAGFLVIRETSMPSVLIESGFVSNYNERKYLNSYEGQTEVAKCIFNAFKKYKEGMEASN